MGICSSNLDDFTGEKINVQIIMHAGGLYYHTLTSYSNGSKLSSAPLISLQSGVPIYSIGEAPDPVVPFRLSLRSLRHTFAVVTPA